MPELEMTAHAVADRDVNVRLVPDLFDLVVGRKGRAGRERGEEEEGFVEVGRVDDTF